MKQANYHALGYISAVVNKQKIYIFALVLFQSLLGLSNVFYALLLKGVIDRAVSGCREGYIQYILLFAALIATQIAMRACVRYLEELAKSSYQNQFKERLFYTLLTRDYQAVSKTHSGEWMNRLCSDSQVVADGLATIVPGIVGMIVRLLGAVGAILFIVPQFAYILIPGGIFLALLTYCFRKKLKALHKIVQEKDGKTRTFMQENLGSSVIVRAFAVEQETAEEAVELMKEHKNARLRKNRFSNICNIGFGTAMHGAYVLALAYCGYGLLMHTMTYGTLMAVLQLIGQVQNPFANITGYIPRFYAMTASAERLMEAEKFRKTETEYKSKAEVLAFYNTEFRELSMEHVDFSYDADNHVLSDFSMTVGKGEFVAFTGMSGCGKSTVLKLLMGLYNPEHGSISVDDSFRRLFAYVPQGNLLMSGTICDVVSMANTEYRNDEEKISSALHIACADFVYDLPEALDTELGERGSGLSEGQMQRLAIARAVFSDCPILMLDEATSALDAETEKTLLENLRALTDKTVLIVTHRPAALSVCDRQIIFGREE